MNPISTDYKAGNYNFAVEKQTRKYKGTETSFQDKWKETSESAVEQYKRRYPQDTARVEAQVQAGKAVREKHGADNVSREDMTMEEYKNFINGLLSSIPFDATRVYDSEVISISEAGWEQMKNDSDYEAWVLGYTAQNRAVRNPFFGWPGASGTFCVEKFGASIEEHIGQSVGKSSSGGGTDRWKNEKSWWEKRQERMRERMEEQIKKELEKLQASQNRMNVAGRNVLAVADYENNMNIFRRNLIVSQE